MKKLLAFLTATILVAAALSGCSGVDSTKEKPTADKDDVKITVWSGDGGAQAVWEEMVDEWNLTTGDKKNIFIDWVTVMDSTQADVAAQNGQLPEIAGLSGTQVEKFALNGSIVPIEELPGGREFLKEYNQPGIEDNNVFNGKQYSVYRKATTSALAYNKDLFKKAGIVDEKGEAKPPKTVAEVREASKKIRALGENIYGFAFPIKFGLWATVDALTAPSFNLDSPVVNTDLDTLTVTYPGYKDRYQWLLDMKKDGSILPGAESLDNDTARAYFASGIIGMIPACSWDVGVYTTQFPAECDWDICDFPTLDGRERWMNYMTISGGFVISNNALKDEKTAKATMEVYKFIYSLETRTKLFELGTDLSCKSDVLEAVDINKVDPRFAKFAALVEDDYKQYPGETYSVEGEGWAVLFEKVWLGEMSLDAAIKDYEKRATKGLRKAVANGDYDVSRQKAIDAEKRADFEIIKAKRAEK